MAAPPPAPAAILPGRLRAWLLPLYSASHTSWARILGTASVLAALALLLVLRQLDGLLHAMHRPAVAGAGVQDLADLGFHLPSPDRAEEVLDTWEAYENHRGAGPEPGSVASWYLWIDYGFIVAYALTFALLLTRSYRRLGTTPGDWFAQRRIALIAALAVPLLALADISENLASDVVISDCSDECSLASFSWLVVSAVLKWALAIGISLALLVAGTTEQLRGIGPTLVVLRIPLALVAFLALLLFGPFGQDQLADVIRRWASIDATDAVSAFVLTTWLGLLLLVVTRRVLDLENPPPGWARSWRRAPNLWWLLAIGALLVEVGVAWQLAADAGSGFTAIGIVLLAVVVLSLPLLRATAPELPDPVGYPAELPALLAAAPTALLGLAVIQATVVEIAYADNADYWLLVLFGLLLLGVTVALYARAHSGHFASLLGIAGFVRASAAVSLGVGLLVWVDPWEWGDVFGVLGLAAAFMLGALALGYWVQILEYRWEPPPSFYPLRLKRVPVLLIVVVSAVLAAFLDDGGYHDIRRLEASSDARKVTFDEAWVRWQEGLPVLSDQGEREAVPLVLVAAEGGGIRAAYWAARVLDCALEGTEGACGYEQEGEPASLRAVFAVSGASGGSLGLLEAVAAQLDGQQEDDWVDDRLDDDYLAATSARTLYADIPNALLRVDLGDDRAAVLEQAWERSWGERKDNPLTAGFLASYTRNPEMPLVLLNGTSVHDGCRVNTSPLDGDVEQANTTEATRRVEDCLSLDPLRAVTGVPPRERGPRERKWVFRATHDLVDELCDESDPDRRQLHDVRLSTAALLSARFPYVSPSGRVKRCESDSAIYVVDGGYFDNTGASPLLELWERLEPRVDEWNRGHRELCIVPVFLHIDNHTREPAASDVRSRPFEVVVPPTALGTSRVGHESNARQAAALEFRGRFGRYVQAWEDGRPLVRHAYVYPRAQPGTDAPLGWALSRASMTSLTKQLDGENRGVLRRVRRWFSPELSCSEAPRLPAGRR